MQFSVLVVLTALSGAVTLISGLVTFSDSINHRPDYQKTRHAFSIFTGTLLLTVVFILATIFSGGANKQADNTPPIPENTPTQITSIPTPQTCSKLCTLYNENGSDNWKGWALNANWNALDGKLLSGANGQPDQWVRAPYQLGNMSDYVVEAEIQVVSGCWTFGIIVRSAQQGNYAVGIYCQPGGPYAVIWAWNGSPGNYSYNILKYSTFDPGTSTHLFETEVSGNDIRLLIDGSLEVEANDNQFTSGGEVGIWSNNEQIAVTSFKITTL